MCAVCHCSGIDDSTPDPEGRCATGPWLGGMCLFEDSQTTAVALEQLRNVSAIGDPFFASIDVIVGSGYFNRS